MILSVVATTLIALLAMAPGWIMMRGRVTGPGMVSAAMVSSLATILLATAVLGAIVGVFGQSLPASAIIGVSLIALIVTGFASRKELLVGQIEWPEWQGIAVGAVLVVFGLFSIASAFSWGHDGSLKVHAWYNADWFKHMGHVHALTNFGVPARDIFGGGGPLHYYWLFYLLPGAAGALGAEPWAALTTINAILSIFLGYLLYALVRMVVQSANGSLALTLASFVVLAPHGFFFWFLGGGTLEAFLTSGLAPSGSGLLETAQVIPQHALATAVLCSWLILAQPSEIAPRRSQTEMVNVLPLIALASVMAISTMLGAIYLLAYGFSRLASGKSSAIPELTLMVIASVSVVFGLEILNISNPDSALDSPLLTNEEIHLPAWRLALAGFLKAIGFVGLPLLVIVPFLLRFKPTSERDYHALVVSLALLAAGSLVVAASQVLLPARPAAEIFVRTKIPFSIAVLILGAMIVRSFWKDSKRYRAGILAIFAGLATVSTPSIFAFMLWQSNFGDTYTTVIPRSDRMVLARLRDASAPDELVWQYPEKPLLGRPAGGDNWSAIFAGRAVPNSERATNFSNVAPLISASENWFEGEEQAIPSEVDWVYLSRALHPETYDRLLQRMDSEPSFTRLDCYADACLFQRRENISQ